MGAIQRLALLVTICILGAHLLGVRPQRGNWIALTATIAFLAWLLGGMTSLRSR